MTVQKQQPYNKWNGDGSNTNFDFDFYIEKPEELVVTILKDNIVIAEPVLNVDYSINEIGNDEGSHIVFPIEGSSMPILNNDETISLSLNIDIEQPVPYPQSEGIQLSKIEKGLDKLTRIAQVQNREIERCVKVVEGSSVTADEVIQQVVTNCTRLVNSAENFANSANLSKISSQNSATLCTEKATSCTNLLSNCENIFDNISEVVSQYANKYNLYDLVMKDHILSFEESKGFAPLGSYVYKTGIAGSRYGYPEFYNKCLKEKTIGVETQVTLGGTDITMYINDNGHQFYNIADKETVDNFYNTMGMAWFYGVDEDNERIFLPRAKYSQLITGELSVVGNGKTLGLTNGTQTSGMAFRKENGSATWYNLTALSSALGEELPYSVGSETPIFTEKTAVGILTAEQLGDNLENSGIKVHQTENTFIYMVVGNTSTVQSTTVELTSDTAEAPLSFDSETGAVKLSIDNGLNVNTNGNLTFDEMNLSVSSINNITHFAMPDFTATPVSLAINTAYYVEEDSYLLTNAYEIKITGSAHVELSQSPDFPTDETIRILSSAIGGSTTHYSILGCYVPKGVYIKAVFVTTTVTNYLYPLMKRGV